MHAILNKLFKMKRIYAIVLIFSFVFQTIQTQSQVPSFGGAGRSGGAGMMGGNMNIGRFYGKIIDGKTNKGLEAVSVQLIQNKFDTIIKKRKDTVISGMLTGKSGNFSLENLPVTGNFRIKITAIGFKTIEQKVAFELKFGGGDMTQALAGIDKDLGNIKLEQSAQELETVTVSATKALVSSSIDRKVFNVEKNINSTGLRWFLINIPLIIIVAKGEKPPSRANVWEASPFCNA